MNLSELARRADVTADTVRHYTRIGLLVPGRNQNNGYRNYNLIDFARLGFIRKARLLGFNLTDIGEILQQSKLGKSPCPKVREIMEQRLQENRLKLQELLALQARMEQAVARWALMPDGLPDGEAICHLIEKFAPED